MKYKIEDKELLTLWQYFQDKSTDVKGAMFNTITWVLGFAAVILGFIFSSLISPDAAESYITLEELMIYASLAGLSLCLYAFFAIGESAKHIRNNWVFADNCKAKIEGLDEILHIGASRKTTKPVVPIWWQLRVVVALFTGAFITILIYASNA